MDKKDRIGIYTFIAANNYGAVLQAYALKETLRKYGYNSYCIDYRPLFLTKKNRLFPSLNRKFNLKSFIRDLYVVFPTIRKNNIFESFRNKHLALAASSGLHTAIIGSDQVWNYKITNGDRVFLGEISDCDNLISYAASMEVGLIESQKEDFINHIKKFNAVSARESSLTKFLTTEIGVESTTVVDPTLLLTKEEWQKLSSPYPKVRTPFVLLYSLGLNKEDERLAEAFAKSKGLQLIKFTVGVKIGDYANDISPEQFIYLFDKASYIITNSFHGTSFAIIFGKKFLEVRNMNLKKNSRVEDLFSLVGVNPASIYNTSKPIEDSDFIQISEYPDTLTTMINSSLQFLKDNV